MSSTTIGYEDSWCTLSSLDLFDDHPRQEEIVDGFWEEISIKSTIESKKIEFQVDGNQSVIDLQNCYIITIMKVTNGDGTNMAAGKEVSIINYPGSTLYKKIVFI